jgi:hypothetical protein
MKGGNKKEGRKDAYNQEGKNKRGWVLHCTFSSCVGTGGVIAIVATWLTKGCVVVQMTVVVVVPITSPPSPLLCRKIIATNTATNTAKDYIYTTTIIPPPSMMTATIEGRMGRKEGWKDGRKKIMKSHHHRGGGGGGGRDGEGDTSP